MDEEDDCCPVCGLDQLTDEDVESIAEHSVCRLCFLEDREDEEDAD